MKRLEESLLKTWPPYLVRKLTGGAAIVRSKRSDARLLPLGPYPIATWGGGLMPGDDDSVGLSQTSQTEPVQARPKRPIPRAESRSLANFDADLFGRALAKKISISEDGVDPRGHQANAPIIGAPRHLPALRGKHPRGDLPFFAIVRRSSPPSSRRKDPELTSESDDHNLVKGLQPSPAGRPRHKVRQLPPKKRSEERRR